MSSPENEETKRGRVIRCGCFLLTLFILNDNSLSSMQNHAMILTFLSVMEK